MYRSWIWFADSLCSEYEGEDGTAKVRVRYDMLIVD